MSRAPRLTIEFLALLAMTVVVPMTTSSLTPPAQAHADIVSSSPQPGATLPSPPSTIALTFTDDVPPDFATVVLTAGDGPAQTLPVSATADPTTISADVDEPAPDGAWRVDYRVTSADGHPIQGSLKFSVEAGSPAATPTPPTTIPDSSASPPTDPTRSSEDPHSRPVSAQPEPADTSTDLALPAVGLGLVLLLVAALAVSRTRRRSGSSPR